MIVNYVIVFLLGVEIGMMVVTIVIGRYKAIPYFISAIASLMLAFLLLN
jgi:hypothetical protein